MKKINRVLKYIELHPSSSKVEITKGMGYDRTYKVSNQIRTLEAMGKIEKHEGGFLFIPTEERHNFDARTLGLNRGKDYVIKR